VGHPAWRIRSACFLPSSLSWLTTSLDCFILLLYFFTMIIAAVARRRPPEKSRSRCRLLTRITKTPNHLIFSLFTSSSRSQLLLYGLAIFRKS
jgi:hypothetical protein